MNIGADEPFELGTGRSRDRVAREGVGAVWLDHVGSLMEPWLADGWTVQFWADVLAGHPELLAALPAGSVPVVWQYDAPGTARAVLAAAGEEAARWKGLGTDLDALAEGFRSRTRMFREAGQEFWVAPGTGTWNSLLGRLDNARENMTDAAEAGLADGATGYLLTCWGDHGMWSRRRPRSAPWSTAAPSPGVWAPTGTWTCRRSSTPMCCSTPPASPEASSTGWGGSASPSACRCSTPRRWCGCCVRTPPCRSPTTPPRRRWTRRRAPWRSAGGTSRTRTSPCPTARAWSAKSDTPSGWPRSRWTCCARRRGPAARRTRSTPRPPPGCCGGSTRSSRSSAPAGCCARGRAVWRTAWPASTPYGVC
ncbi:hypothetical protein ACFQ60_05155 [Streptomyces zhihengii]